MCQNFFSSSKKNCQNKYEPKVIEIYKKKLNKPIKNTFFIMRKRSLYFLLSFFSVFFAQENGTAMETSSPKTWEYDVKIGVNLLNIGLYNWVGGGTTFLSGNTRDYVMWQWTKEPLMWTNRFETAYGGLYNYKPKQDFPYRKTDDFFSYSTALDYILTPHWNIVMLGNLLKSQWAPGYNYLDDANGNLTKTKVSDIFSPGYNYTYIGVRYRYNTAKTKFYFMLAPVAFQQIIVRSPLLSGEGLAGVTPGKHWQGNWGGLLDTRYEQLLYKDQIQFFTQLQLFYRYDNPPGPTLDWQTGLSWKMWKYFVLNFNTDLIYDYYTMVLKDDGTRGRAVQFKYVLSLGIAMQFTNISKEDKK